MPYRPYETPEGQLTGSSHIGPTRYRPAEGNQSFTAETKNEGGYYGLPILKRPVWRSDVWQYFFFGGVAGGSFAIASLAVLFGSPRERVIARVGYVISFLALLACPPLLIKDLGRPEKFLNMLRVFKPGSPMSMGVWGLLSFSLFSTLAFSRTVLSGAWGPVGWVARLIPERLVAIVGIPFACFLASYTGVLLSVTNIPVWARSRLIGATFLASAFSSSAASITLALRLRGEGEETLAGLDRIERVAALAEAGALAGYLVQASRAAKPLLAPSEYGAPFLLGTIGLGLAVPLVGGLRARAGVPSGLLALSALVGGVMLRYAFVESGQASSQDTDTYLWMTDKPVH